MIVNKFGGASVKDAESIKRMSLICGKRITSGIIVVSAMGKVTNMLERLVYNFFSRHDCTSIINEYELYHTSILKELFESDHYIFKELNDIIQQLKEKIIQAPSLNYNFEYDQIVPFGELLSTKIIAAYLSKINIENEWVDIQSCLKTDSTYREAEVEWSLTQHLMKSRFSNPENKLYITQGFIGSDINNLLTTLGREGSDYTASVLANVLDAKKVIVWKDVPGIMCADPAWLPNTQKLERISYFEAIELSYYGAKVIHPKTMKPLQNKNIELEVRSFINDTASGTIIGNFSTTDTPPIYIQSNNQVLISILPLDYSFITANNLSHLFAIIAKWSVKINLIQNSAVSFSILVDSQVGNVRSVITELKHKYDVKYNDNLELVTIRHYKPNAEIDILKNKVVMLKQQSRGSVCYVTREING